MAVCAAALAVVGLLAAVVVRPIAPGSLDARVHDLALADRSPALVAVARVLTDLGSASVVVPLVGVAVLAMSAPPLRHRLGCAAVALSVLASGALVRLAVSVLIGRARPPAADWAAPAAGYAFPSGHTTSSALAAGVLAWTVTRQFPHRRRVHIVGWCLAVLFTLAVGTTRVVLGVHWPTDVLGGWAFATAWLSGWLLVLRRYALT